MQDSEERVIAYVSHNLEGGQLNYCTTKRKLLAVVTFVEHFYYYLYGQQFTVRTDHASLRWLRNFRNIDGLLARWLSKLEKYDFTIVHRKGPQHGNADGLSHIPHRKCPRCECPHCSSTVKKAYRISRKTRVETDEWLERWSNEDLLEWQRSDLVLKRVTSWLETPTQNPSGVSKYDRRAKVYLGQLENLHLNEQGIICWKWYPPSKGLMGQMISQVVAPRVIRARILRSLHNSPTGAHLGRIKTINCIRYIFYWPGDKEDVINWCCRCYTCAQTKPGPKCQKAKLAQVPVAGPMERIAVDIMGPVP